MTKKLGRKRRSSEVAAIIAHVRLVPAEDKQVAAIMQHEGLERGDAIRHAIAQTAASLPVTQKQQCATQEKQTISSSSENS